MPSYLQVLQLQRGLPGWLKHLFFLEASLQQRMARQKVCWDTWKQISIHLLRSERHQQTMIIQNLKIFSQNVCKNSLVTNTILETLSQFDIIFIQEPPWSEIRKTLSSLNCKGKPLMSTCHHPNWIVFTRLPTNSNDFPRVISYVNIHLKSLCFLLRKDIFDHRDINIISFTINDICHYILNIYSDSSHSALKYLKDTEVNINNVLLMMGDFNIRDSL